MNKHEGSTLVERKQCPECAKQGRDRSGDNLGVFDDGHSFCFACSQYYKAEGSEPIQITEPTVGAWKPVVGKMRGLDNRGIEQDVCRKFRYRSAKINGEYAEAADYIVDGKLVAQHLKLPTEKGKTFRWWGDRKQARLWGQHLWRMGGGKIIITEGEIDAMTVWQTMGRKWPVVSLPNGAADAVRSIMDSLEFLSSYKEVVLCFDEDEPGRTAALECAEILPPGKAKIVSLPYKDANAMLLKKESKALVSAFWDVYSQCSPVHASLIQMQCTCETSG